ncbi:hypothetical protein BH23THE1_BH23THE1_23510 [soil metagenome]
MSTQPTKDNKRDRVIDLYKEGKNMREIAKDVHLSFSTIDKIIRESNGQVEPKPEKSITSRAFFLFENKKSLVRYYGVGLESNRGRKNTSELPET